MFNTSANQATNLSVDVEPFVPRMGDPNPQMLNNNPLPRYVTTCYPFVQDQQQLIRAAGYPWPVGELAANNFAARADEINIQQPIIAQSAILSYQPYSEVHAPNVADKSGNPAVRDQIDIQKGNQSTKGSLATPDQITESVESSGNAYEITKVTKIVEMADAAQQTDFPLGISSQSLIEKPSPLKKATQRRPRRRAPPMHGESSSDLNAEDADIDSDSGYYSPKHQIHFSRKRNQTNSTGNQTEASGNNKYTSSSPQIMPTVYLSSNSPVQPQPFVQIPQQTALYHQQPNGLGYIMAVTPPVMIPQYGFGGNVGTAPIGYNRLPMNSLQPYDITMGNPNMAMPAFNTIPAKPYYGSKKHGKYGVPHYSDHSGDYFAQCYQHPELITLRDRNNNIKSKKKEQPNHDYVDTILHHNSRGIIKLNSNNNINPYQPPPILQSQVDFPGLGGSSESENLPNTSFSYSAALQKPKGDQASISSLEAKNLKKRRKKAERAAKAAEEEYAEITKEQENIKKAYSSSIKKNKNKPTTSQLDLGEILDKLDRKQTELRTSSEDIEKRNQNFKNQSKPKLLDSSCNPLDPTAPSNRRGKEREVPKIKKPSALKKVILKEREEKKTNRLTMLETNSPPDFDIPGLPSDFINSDISQPDNSQSSISTSSATPQSDPQASLPVADNSSLPKIHSRRFREYCCQFLDKQIDDTCSIILQRLVQFQDRLYQKDPIKAKMRRRFVLGLREVTKHLKLKRLKCILISPNLEKIQSKGGLDEAMQLILNLCNEQNVPYVFALGRCAMGRAVSKLVPVSIVGIFDFSGVEEHYSKLMLLVQDAKDKYQEMIMSIQQEIIEANAQPLVPAAKKFVAKGHSRNPSAASCMSFSSMLSEPISEMNPDAEVSNWRTIMEVNNLSPPPENGIIGNHKPETPSEEPQAEDNESSASEIDNDKVQPQDGGIKRSNSYKSDGKLSESQLERSFSNCSTLQNNKSVSDNNDGANQKSISSASDAKLGKLDEDNANVISSVATLEEDKTARINSWLLDATNSVSNIQLKENESKTN